MNLTTPRGRTYLRALLTRTNAGDTEAAARAFSQARWGFHEGESIAKAAVASVGSASVTPEAREFFAQVQELSIIGRLAGLRRVPFLVRLLAVASGTTGYWVGEAKPKPLSRPVLAGSALYPLKVAALVCATVEATREGGDLTESVLQSDLVRAVALALDEAFIDSANSGIANVSPSAITFGAPTIASTGNPAADLKALIAAFSGDLARAYLVTDPSTATELALARDSAGSFEFPDAGPRGGSVLGIPLLTSAGSPRDSSGGQIALVDPSAIAIGLDVVSIAQSEHASLLMSDTPADGPGQLVSLYQTDSVAFRAETPANWELQHAGAVAVIVGASY